MHSARFCALYLQKRSVISNPKLTYQKANAIVKIFIEEDANRINQNFQNRK